MLGRDQASRRYEAVDLGDQRVAPGVEPEYLFRKKVSSSRLDQPRPEPLAQAGFSGGELVLGVVRDGAARGYVLSQMAYYHLVNDELGGRPLLVTFCARCFSGGAFDPLLDGQVLTFELHGVYQGAFTIVDDQVGSIWSHMTGEALVGPMAGRYLEPIALHMMPLGAWLERYPDSSTVKPGQVPHRPTAPGQGRLDEGWWRTVSHRDRRLSPRTPVLGVRLGEAHRAYVLDSQAQGPRLFQDELAGVPIVLLGVDGGAPLAYDRRVESGTIDVRLQNGALADTSGSVWNHEGVAIDGALAGTQLKFVPSKVSEWYAWVAYHPDTDVVRFPARA
jgi:hypothetical protein